jgi:hypothetical protein
MRFGSDASSIRTKTFRALAGILGVASFAFAALLIATSGPLATSALLLAIPYGLVFLQFSFIGKVTRSAWVFVGTFLILRIVAGLVDRDSCLDAGGSYVDEFEGCVGESRAAGLLLAGSEEWKLWLVVLAISLILALVAFRLVIWADGVAKAVREHRANQDRA